MWSPNFIDFFQNSYSFKMRSVILRESFLLLSRSQWSLSFMTVSVLHALDNICMDSCTDTVPHGDWHYNPSTSFFCSLIRLCLTWPCSNFSVLICHPKSFHILVFAKQCPHHSLCPLLDRMSDTFTVLFPGCLWQRQFSALSWNGLTALPYS